MQIDIQVIPRFRRLTQSFQRTRVSGGETGHFIIVYVVGNIDSGALQKRSQFLPHPHDAVIVVRRAPLFRLHVTVVRVDLVGFAGMGMIQKHALLTVL